MKLGDAAKALGVTSDTIVNWIEKFPTLFSAEARKIGRTQREILDLDFMKLNTIRAEKPNWDRARARIEAHNYEDQYPDSIASTSVMTHVQYQVNILAMTRQVAELEDRLAQIQAEAETRIARVQAELDAERLARANDRSEADKALERVVTEKEAEKERLLREMGELKREIGKLEGKLEARNE